MAPVSANDTTTGFHGIRAWRRQLFKHFAFKIPAFLMIELQKNLVSGIERVERFGSMTVVVELRIRFFVLVSVTRISSGFGHAGRRFPGKDGKHVLIGLPISNCAGLYPVVSDAAARCDINASNRSSCFNIRLAIALHVQPLR